MANKWLRNAFEAKQVNKAGGVVRRKITSVERHASTTSFVEEAIKQKAWAVFSTETQIVAVFKTNAGVTFHHLKAPQIK